VHSARPIAAWQSWLIDRTPFIRGISTAIIGAATIKQCGSKVAIKRHESDVSVRFASCRLSLYNILYNTRVKNMDAITYSTARAKLADTMDRVCNDHEAIMITRSGQQAVVMMSLDNFNALEETSYLLRSPKNARRLLEAIASLEAGNGQERNLAK